MGCFKSLKTTAYVLLCILTLSLAACGQQENADAAAVQAIDKAAVDESRSDSSVDVNGVDTSSLKEANWREHFADEPSSLAGAASLEEAKWLSRNGFLTRQERAKFEQLARKETERLAKAGDANAILYLAEQDINAGNGAAATYGLNRLVQKKHSIPALHLLAKQAHETETLNGQVGTGPSAAATLLMQAFVLGDYKAGLALSRVHPRGVPPAVFTDAIRKLSMEQDTFKKSNGGRLPAFDPRPVGASVNGLAGDEESFWKEGGNAPEL